MSGLDPLLQGSPALNDSGVRKKLLVSHLITRLGTQGWLFIAPLVLTRFTPASILGPAVYGMVTMLATMFIVPTLGKFADRTDRKCVITLGVGLQFIAVAGSTGVILMALAESSGPQQQQQQQQGGQQQQQSSGAAEPNWSAVALFTLFGIVEKLGTMLSDVSVKREWAPQLFSGQEMASVNALMSQIDLSTEVVGPFIAGLLITFGGAAAAILPPALDATDIGFVAVGLLNALSFGPQLALLKGIYRTHSQFLQPTPPEKVQNRRGPVPPQGAWGTWWKHPGGLVLLSSSYSLLYLTVLSPHGALLTAVLQLGQVPSWQLSLLRGAGALMGIIGTMCRPPLGRCAGNRAADGFSVCWLAVSAIVALVAFRLAAADAGGAVQGITMPLLLFMAAVCLGRPGLYAFELGVLNTEQDLVDKRHRSAVGAVDTALQSGATVVMYGAGMYWSSVEDFGLLVAGSAFFVSCGALVYLAWVALFKAKQHRHFAGQGQDHGHGHSHESDGHAHSSDDHLHHDHTLQMEEMMEVHADGSALHEHIFYDPGSCVVQ